MELHNNPDEDDQRADANAAEGRDADKHPEDPGAPELTKKPSWPEKAFAVGYTVLSMAQGQAALAADIAALAVDHHPNDAKQVQTHPGIESPVIYPAGRAGSEAVDMVESEKLELGEESDKAKKIIEENANEEPDSKETKVELRDSPEAESKAVEAPGEAGELVDPESVDIEAELSGEDETDTIVDPESVDIEAELSGEDETENGGEAGMRDAGTIDLRSIGEIQPRFPDSAAESAAEAPQGSGQDLSSGGVRSGGDTGALADMRGMEANIPTTSIRRIGEGMSGTNEIDPKNPNDDDAANVHEIKYPGSGHEL